MSAQKPIYISTFEGTMPSEIDHNASFEDAKKLPADQSANQKELMSEREKQQQFKADVEFINSKRENFIKDDNAKKLRDQDIKELKNPLDYPKTRTMSEENLIHRDAEEKQMKEEKKRPKKVAFQPVILIENEQKYKGDGTINEEETYRRKPQKKWGDITKLLNTLENQKDHVKIEITPAVAPVMPSSPAMPVMPSVTPVTTTLDPLSSFLLNMMFVMLFYFVATKIFTFYGIGTEVYGIYFTFYLFLYITTMILPTEHAKIKLYKNNSLLK